MDLKKKLVEKVLAIEDKEILCLLEDWLEEISLLEVNFSKEEIAAVAEGYSQYKNGEVVDEEEANRLFEKW